MSRLILMGSGETAPSMLSTHRAGMDSAGADKVTVIDTPFGFQENAEQLTARIASFFKTSLGVETEVATMLRRNPSAIEVEKMLATLRHARYVFAGPGSPSYALDVWEASGLADALTAMIGRGGVLTLASAAALTAGTHTIPVYEIYKVGQEPFWRPGLDVTGRLGLPMVVVPHWNNAEGGNHDTSRCFIGRRRLEMLSGQIEVGMIGIDEHTAAVLDFEANVMTVTGLGTVTLVGEDETLIHHGDTISLHEVAGLMGARPGATVAFSGSPPEMPLGQGKVDEIIGALLALEEEAAVHPDRRADLRTGLVDLARAAERGLIDPRQVVGDYVALLLELRAVARSERRFEDADRIREGLVELGVEVRDSGSGTEWDLLG